MAKIRVGINGYGTIGKRVADAVLKMPDMELIGVVKVTPDYSAIIVSRKGIRIYTLKERMELFINRDIPVAGTFEELLEEADIIVDATPGGIGEKYSKIYKEKNIHAIFQGGEKPHTADISFSSLCNYSEALGARSIRVVSCNTTGLLRTICTLNKFFGIEKVRATIIRRAADPKEDKRGPVNSIRLNPPKIPSHHGIDAKTVVPWLDIKTAAVAVPTTLMHVQSVYIVLKQSVKKEDIIDALKSTKRILLINAEETGIDSTSKLIEAARDLGRPRNDIPELVIWEDSINVEGKDLWLLQAVHQESIVIPENIDAIRASLNIIGEAEKSIELTDKILGLGKLF